MAKGRRGMKPAAARWLWSARGARLFDPAGVEYAPARHGLLRCDVDRLVRARELPLAVHDCGDGVSWNSETVAFIVWSSVQDDFEDVEGWMPPADAPGALPYRAEIWRSAGTDRHVLVLRND
ncbi:hypothetical protein ABEG17_11195 [Pedococcus sp. KACC 23699]|uniref:Uncharacterized protein n=1 Tax=Pedococcus sp. KACC 23699 TaxID=3149228 RepID=A0AAU7JPQ2_9MICO